MKTVEKIMDAIEAEVRRQQAHRGSDVSVTREGDILKVFAEDEVDCYHGGAISLDLRELASVLAS